MKYNPVLKAQILGVVDNQLRDNNPPETRKTMDRLQKKGYSVQRAKEMIGSVVVKQLYEMMSDKRVFDEAEFVRDLQALE